MKSSSTLSQHPNRAPGNVKSVIWDTFSPQPSILSATANSNMQQILADKDIECRWTIVRIRYSREEMDRSKSIVVSGLDSLVAIEIRNWSRKRAGGNLQVSELLTSSSFMSLALMILKKSKLVDFRKGEKEGLYD